MNNHVLVAGTFETIHKGHEKILQTALTNGNEITIALTSDIFTTEYKQGDSSPFEKRKTALEDWLKDTSSGKIVHIIPIDDPFEPAVSGNFDALIVSTQTRTRAEEINNKRLFRGLDKLSIIEVPMVLALDGKPISSTRVRVGEIDRLGRLILPDSLRDELIRPVGTLLVSDEEIQKALKDLPGKTIITVGDVTTTKLLHAGFVPSLSIIDLMVQRKPYTTFDAYKFSANIRIMRVASGPGFIADTAIEAITDWATDVKAGRNIPYAIVVHGEEDLLVLPAIVAAPVGSVVLYGQPDCAGRPPGVGGASGLVIVTVTKELQTRIEEILSRFTSVKEE